MDCLHWILAGVAIVFALLFYRTRYLAGKWKACAEKDRTHSAKLSMKYDELTAAFFRQQDSNHALRCRVAEALKEPEA